jgi:hypothetical protein
MYNCGEYTAPMWKGNMVLHESFMPVNSDCVKMLYDIDEIISVMNAEQTITYEYGKDYELKDKMLYIPNGSAIRIMSWEEYNPTDGDGFECSLGGYLKFSEGTAFHKLQYEISYKHSDLWNGFIPSCNPDKLPKIKQILSDGKPFTFGFLGDSITVGWNSSKITDISPFAPIWCEMIVENLTEKYGCDIKYVNKAVGGTASGWGNENAIEFFKDDIPDIFVIAFGMNDASGKVNELVFRDNCKSIADKILTLNPDCEIIFVSTTMPNQLASQFVGNHELHEDLLAEVTASYGNAADLACITSIHKQLLKRKKFHDMTGNNINHPNDFLARVYTQTVLQCFYEL